MIKPVDLRFKKLDTPPPDPFCNSCGATVSTSGWRMANFPIRDGTQHASILVCSKNCQRQYMHSAEGAQHLEAFITRLEAPPAPEPTAVDVERYRNQLQSRLGFPLTSTPN
ncbi:hypothetical protein [Fibrella aestuarina]|uniref:hypothetical protein n=1 Tax=Fibrella aestuarina TaxID=651143 RepID=UPI0003138CC4|nr:hypothetical protein [Fibrella aestuarina]